MHYPVPLKPHTHEVAQHLHILPDDVRENHTRGHGHGGQKKNKSTNCVELIHVPTGVKVRVDTHRHLSANREAAWELLVEKVEMELIGKLEEKERQVYHDMKAASRLSKDGHELSQKAKQLQAELRQLEEQKHSLKE